MSRPILEVIALSAEDAAAAEAGGADRLEVVADMAADGLTPALETFTAIRAAVAIPLRVMLRLADGFRTGGDTGVAALRERARTLRAEGADEFVLGFLDDSGQADLRAVEAVTDAVAGCPWTFHRAIDRAADRDALRKQLAEAPGLDTYLTAGSPDGVTDGYDVLLAEAARTTAKEPGYRPRLMVGGGLTLSHVPGLSRAGITAFHIGGAARPQGWDTPVDPAAVRAWREALDGA
ncbi:copper homeostasis protein CutC [Streptomyces reniochalinae]|uniref:Copper homeostasis protein cutC homolog n=1 Tax=Streptomyces reniochalinae TaxID=2250578 RepID=A0A367EJ98_9ACTN|nr:copper homeostasis protein CutC [Streptomyces reniochalinae]RCG18033.1 copper homeostasis protein CutC [Streptomyces reniochalinae]